MSLYPLLRTLKLMFSVTSAGPEQGHRFNYIKLTDH